MPECWSKTLLWTCNTELNWQSGGIQLGPYVYLVFGSQGLVTVQQGGNPLRLSSRVNSLDYDSILLQTSY